MHSCHTAIAIQIMELVADKKGIDQSAFAPINSDLGKMKELLGVSSGGSRGPPSAGGQQRAPTTNERDAKRPRM